MYVELDVPEISEHMSGFSQYWVCSLFIRPASSSYQIRALTDTYVRLVGSAIIEYHSGRSKLKEYYSDTPSASLKIGIMLQAMSHFETCISNMYRATNCFWRLRRRQDPLSTYINQERERAKFATDAIADRFGAIRNKVHHLEEMVMDGHIADGQPFALGPSGPETPHPSEDDQTTKRIDGLTIGSNEVKFSELATWLKEMAYFVDKIANFLPNSNEEL